MEPGRIQRLRERILEERRRILGAVRGIEAEIRGWSAQRPVEFNERGEEETALHLLSELDVRQRRELTCIEQALARMRAGTYGICFRCGEDIPEDRLEAAPYTTLCKGCARASASA